MKCINRIKLLGLVFLFCIPIVFAGCKKEKTYPVKEFEEQKYRKEIRLLGSLLSDKLCVSESDVSMDGYAQSGKVHASALFDLNNSKVLQMTSAHERIYPASITKNMTALLALELGNLEDEVVISKTAAASNFHPAAQVCGIKAGDVWTLEALLNALMMYSGNDVALAIAEHIAGTEEAFVDLMNQKAADLMANNTHFMNPHGLHHDNHYTTAYDIYLIFQECLKDERFVDLINQDACTIEFVDKNGTSHTKKFPATNWYAKGIVAKPKNATILGGKTGTTDEGGYCLILYEQKDSRNYISVVMGAETRPLLYKNMTAMIQAIP